MNMRADESVLIKPYGGALVSLLAQDEERHEVHAQAASLPRLQMSPRNICDLELLATGGFSPLDRFMRQADYLRVIEEMRLTDGTLFPMPVTLHVKKEMARKLDTEVALADQHNNILAVMQVED